MSLKDIPVGWCFGCNREVEMRGPLLIPHGRESRCIGSDTVPRTPPREGTWTPPARPVQREPGPVEGDTDDVFPRRVRGFWRALITEANERIRP
jgi:hypothetical protein